MNYILIANSAFWFEKIREIPHIHAMIDTERLGKRERQPEANNVISDHKLEDIVLAREYLPKERVLVRINPWHSKSVDEVNEAIALGAGNVMLPMYTHRSEVEDVLACLDGRARLFLLAETPAALLRFETYAELLPADTVIHIGLNDLRLAMGVNHMFEILAGGIVGFAAEKFKRRGLTFGIGGVGCNPDDPVPYPLILRSHSLLGSSWVILSQSFKKHAAENFASCFEELEDTLRGQRNAGVAACLETIQKEIFQRLAPSMVATPRHI